MAPVASSKSETNARTMRSEISALRLFLEYCASNARMPTKRVIASELRRFSMRSIEVNTIEKPGRT
jgi:antitoxin component of RelBE/YafQ-DinJ toxin-antitoxin module